MSRRLDPVRDLFDPDRMRCFPADYDDLDGYKERFVDTARLFELFVKRCASIEPVHGEEAIAVIVMPWWGTPSPWYAIAIGLGLARRGRSIVFVWHDLPFPHPSRYLTLQNDEIGRLMRALGRRFPVVRLSELPDDPQANTGDAALLDRLAAENLMWLLRGTPPSDDDLVERDRMRSCLSEALPKVHTLYRTWSFRAAIECGGVIGPSGLYLDAGRAAGVRVATFDAGLGAAAVNTDGVAAQPTDVPRAFDMLTTAETGAPDGELDIVQAAQEEFHRRRRGIDPDGYQIEGSGADTSFSESSILIPLSVVFDAAALGRHHIFQDSREWLIETITSLLKHTTDEIIVRQHPSERRPMERSGFDVQRLLAESFGTNPQVRFVAAAEPISTYELLELSRLVIPFVSTIGIEAAALGKPVIVAGSVYYAGMGFVWAPTSRGQYFELLERAARRDLPLLPQQAERAWKCYYLTAVCLRVRTDFTPQPPDYWRWVVRTPDELFQDPDVEDLLRSIDDAVPLSIVRHERLQRSPEPISNG